MQCRKVVFPSVCLAFLGMAFALAANDGVAPRAFAAGVEQGDSTGAALPDGGSMAPKPAKFAVASPSLKIALSNDGEIVGPFGGCTRLEGCERVGTVAVEKLAGGGYAFTRTLTDAQKHQCKVTDRFTPTGDSIRWEVEIVGDGAPWTTAIETQLAYHATAKTRFWTAWSDPEHRSDGWRDPRVLLPFSDMEWSYSNLGYLTPEHGDFIALPLVTVAEPETDTAVSLVLSPEDTLLDMWLKTEKAGVIRFTHHKHRLGEGKTVRFAMDLVGHEADWRGGLRWMTTRYPEFFDPPNPAADEMAGCGAYSGDERPIDVARFKKMAFRINWKLSDDFPYMGMFIPPVKDVDETWTRSCDEPTPPGKKAETSCRQMNDYARYMKDNGFFVLNYFNVTEFGKNMTGGDCPDLRGNENGTVPLAATAAPDAADSWKDPRAFMAQQFPDAVMPGSTFYGAHVTDCGAPAYREFLLEQADRHIKMLPDTAGICIDRMDWLRGYNTKADDGISWVDGRPARALTGSWKSLMAKLGPMMHDAGKVIFCNPMTMRIDLMREIDGIYSEHGEEGPGLNTIALVAMRKPALTWSCMWWKVPFYNLKPDPDSFFQRHLLMGVYPTAPYPSNNHALLPNPETDEHYLAYGPLLDAMRGKKWVLAPHCIEATSPSVKVNLFQVRDGYVAPVTFGDKAETATIQIRNVSGLANAHAHAEALHPGVDAAVPVELTFKDGVLELTVPLVRGCAMVLIRE